MNGITHLQKLWPMIFMIALNVIISPGCEKKEDLSPKEVAYINEIQEWHQKRITGLTSKDGWLSLAGLYWLKEGKNTFGSAEENNLKFPLGEAPDFIGSIYLEKGTIRCEINSGINVFSGGKKVSSVQMKADVSGEPTILELNSLSWFIIKRGEEYGVRLRDSENENITRFKGIEMFPIDTTWRVSAKLEPYDPPKIIEVPTILGTISKETSPGALVFRLRGNIYRLDPIAEPGDESLFVIFADQTNGSETYDAGRFLYVNKPNENDSTIIDFNKAYNPPCAFTSFATCPLPPTQNVLPIRITAGEKKYAHP